MGREAAGARATPLAAAGTRGASEHDRRPASSALVRSSLADDPRALAPLLAKHAAVVGPCATLYVQIAGAGDAVSPALLEWLAALYRGLAGTAPRLNLVPLLPFAGWDEAAIAGLGSVEQLHAGGDNEAGGASLAASGAPPPAAGAGESSEAGAARAAMPALPPPAPAAGAGPTPTAAGAQGQRSERLRFERVAVGGTFDRLHAGHRLLLAATALVATDAVFAGVTADQLLARKDYRELLQPYDARCAAALGFMRAVRPGVRARAGALSDPAAPTEAELDPGMQALVVSHETLAGGEAINSGRAARGFAPLRLVVVGVVGERPDGSKLSSSELRQQDAATAAAGAAAGGAGGTADR